MPSTLPGSSSEAVPVFRAGGPAPGAEGRRRVLVIDDEEAILFAMADYLGFSGYAVDCACSREEAEELLSRGPYAAVIADLRLGPSATRDGLDLLRQVREGSLDTSLILLTAYGSADIEAELSDLQGALLLSKPQPLPKICEVVKRLLADAETACTVG